MSCICSCVLKIVFLLINIILLVLLRKTMTKNILIGNCIEQKKKTKKNNDNQYNHKEIYLISLFNPYFMFNIGSYLNMISSKVVLKYLVFLFFTVYVFIDLFVL